LTRIKKPTGRENSKSRSIRSLSRQGPTRDPSQIIIIVCEGEKTEPIYFNNIRDKKRLHSVNVRIIPNPGSSLLIVKRAIDERKCIPKEEKKDYEVWCVFDVEQKGHNPSFNEAVQKAKNNGLKLAISNPCFEYWYLLHFEPTSRSFIDCKDIITQLKVHIKSYQKAISIYPNIEDNTSIAIENANSLRKSSENNWEDFPNSSTGVDFLVKKITKDRDNK